MSETAAPGPVREMPLAEALDWEAARLADIAEGRAAAAALLWSCEPALVAPKRLGGLPGFARAGAAAAEAGWPVHLRATGGDLVPQGPGVTNLTLLFRAPPGPAPGLDDAYRHLTAPIRAALADLGIDSCHGSVPGAFCDGRFNVTVAGRKFAGTAQRWRPVAAGHAVQSHAMMLMRGPDPDMIATLNRFYRDCGIDRRIEAAAHVGLHDLAGPGQADAMQGRFLAGLAERVLPRSRFRARRG
ncbi:lipoyl protein ligase domain-containing protein [Frigidibacter sp. ROC022]|uniref:lipoyl protein ligase domain-containing protein n=1 Tax=Frigidibacter sp. ROC022 TaxID=2971796 RepID=UPI00215A62BC|nr:hypothetical protein [Frigidibacter sp. ROC022]MCR8722698.1 hypothetical protein [Frigidibacter sp. ROC022]